MESGLRCSIFSVLTVQVNSSLATWNLLGLYISSLSSQLPIDRSMQLGVRQWSLPEETFLQRLLEKEAIKSSNGEESSNVSTVEAGLVSRKAGTMKTLKCLLQAIDFQRSKNDELSASLRNIVSPHGKFLSGYWDGRHASYWSSTLSGPRWIMLDFVDAVSYVPRSMFLYFYTYHILGDLVLLPCLALHPLDEVGTNSYVQQKMFFSQLYWIGYYHRGISPGCFT